MSRVWNILENASDALLLILLTIPAVFLIILTPFCGGWNEGTMSGTCSIGALEGFYNGFNGFMLVAAFTVMPFVFIVAPCLLILSAAAKIVKYSRGYRPVGAAYMTEIVRFIPFVILVLVLRLFFT